MNNLTRTYSLSFLICTLATLAAQDFKVLVFSKTAGFRHESIESGQQLILDLAVANGFAVDITEDAGEFSEANLAQYQVVVFLNTTGDILNIIQQVSFERWLRNGNGWVGIHSAADTEYDWAWYGDLLGGAYFAGHPEIQNARVKVVDRAHPSTGHLPALWERNDEWYNYQVNPRGTVHVLATLDESTYSGGSNGYDHPIAWCHAFDGGRAWYTGGGHTSESYDEPLFQDHLLGGILYAAGAAPVDCGATRSANFARVILDDETSNPMELAVAPDGRVFYVEREGTLRIYKPDIGNAVYSGQLDVSTLFEDGLMGIALDPGFAANDYVYLYYSPAGDEPVQYLSRFTMQGDALNPLSEIVMLEVGTQRDQCCHSGGSLAFGPNGNLFLSTGDNTNPFESDGYTPIDERDGRSAWDAQKSASNTQDLRGKILRITPQPDGSYSIPDGNLFSDDAEGRPEIYIMGCRNPFRIATDSQTGWLYWGEVGPDAGAAGNLRGPAGHDEFNQAREAGNYGWPYCIADNMAYYDYNFANGQSGPLFDCDNPVNDSPNNSGSFTLPPARAAMIYYPYESSGEFPELGSGGRTAMAGPVYHYDPENQSIVKLPEYYDKTLFIYEWSRNWIKEVKLDDEGNLLVIQPFLDEFTFVRPMDMEIGPDGAIYMLEWGTEFGGNNTDSRLTRLEYHAADPTPIIDIEDPHVPASVVLYDAYPNPFNPTTQITFSLPVSMHARLEIFDVLGRSVSVLFDQMRSAGWQNVVWDAGTLPSGTYIYRLTSQRGAETKQVVLSR